MASLLPVVLGLCLALATAASVLAPIWRHGMAGSYAWLGGGAVYVAVYGALAWGVRRSPLSEKATVIVMVAAVAAIKLALVVWTSEMPLHADQDIFHSFVRRMADGRPTAEVMGELSRIYDYPLWTGRGMPFHYLARRWLAPNDVMWMKLANVGVSTLVLLAVYGFARRLLPQGTRKWAVFAMAARPFQSVVTTDYSHHLFSSFYLLAGTWCLWEIVFSPVSMRRRVALSATMAVSLTLMTWQRGTHWVALATWWLVLPWMGLFEFRPAKWAGWVFFAGIVPLALSIPLANQFDGWLASHDPHRLNSVLPGFVARGWCPESGGEYCGRYEQLDRVTPWPEKPRAMFRLVLSQIRRNTAAVCVRFPFEKTAKLFMVGYASNFEEGLALHRPWALAWARGARIAGAPLFLIPAFLGCCLLASAPHERKRWLPIVLVPTVTWGAYVFFGETSPRYSIFFQPFLALPAGWALGVHFEGQGEKALAAFRKESRGNLMRALFIVGSLGLALAALALGVRALPDDRFYADLEQGWSASPGASVKPGAYRPFEAELLLPARQAEPAVFEWAFPSGRDGERLSLYVLDAAGSAVRSRLSMHVMGETLWTLPLAELTTPQYVAMPLPSGAESLTMLVEADGTFVAADGPGRVVVGYVFFPLSENAQ